MNESAFANPLAPPTTTEPPKDPKAEARAEERKLIMRVFTSAEGAAAMTLMRDMAKALPSHPVNYPDSAKATQLLWWKEARTAFLDEIEEIIRQETEK